MKAVAVKQTRKGQTGYRAAIVHNRKAGQMGRPKTERLGHSSKFVLHQTKEGAIEQAQSQIDKLVADRGRINQLMKSQ